MAPRLPDVEPFSHRDDAVNLEGAGRHREPRHAVRAVDRAMIGPAIDAV